MLTEFNKCKGFLHQNGFTPDDDVDEYVERLTNGQTTLDISPDQIVFISDEGDWLRLGVNLFELIGAMVTYRLIPYNFDTAFLQPRSTSR